MLRPSSLSGGWGMRQAAIGAEVLPTFLLVWGRASALATSWHVSLYSPVQETAYAGQVLVCSHGDCRKLSLAARLGWTV